MKAHYAGREEEMPYKTLAGFRRARRAQAESYKKIRKNLHEDLTIAKNNSILLDVISLPDEKLPHSLGAKWSNYNIRMPDGTVAHFLEGSKLHHKQVFAGKGCKRKIDQIDSLVEIHGGNAEDWQKIKAVGTIVKENGEIEEAEIHWYEEPSVGKVRLKYKKQK